jgi:rubrerythrin
MQDLVRYSSKQFTDQATVYFKKATTSAIAQHMHDVFLSKKRRHPETDNLVKSVSFKGFRHLADKLEAAKKPEEAFARLREIFGDEGGANEQQPLPHGWRCHGCGIVFRYERQVCNSTMNLPVCPCCTTAPSWSLTRKRKKTA